MKVDSFEVKPKSDNITFQLLVNDMVISNNFTYVDFRSDFIQIDVCELCNYPGCSSEGYIEARYFNKYIVWKEVAETNTDFITARGLRHGSIFWTIEQYKELISISEEKSINYKELSLEDAFDLWKYNASKSYSPEGYESFSLDHLEERMLGMYSEILSEEECFVQYNKAKKLWSSGTQCNLVELTDFTKKIVFMFDTPHYREWDCLYIDKGDIIFPIDKDIFVSIS